MNIKSGLLFIAFHSNQRRKIPVTEILYSGVGLCHITIYHVTIEKLLHCSLLYSVVIVGVLSHSLHNEKDICKKATQIKLEQNHKTAKDSHSYSIFRLYGDKPYISIYICPGPSLTLTHFTSYDCGSTLSCGLSMLLSPIFSMVSAVFLSS